MDRRLLLAAAAALPLYARGQVPTAVPAALEAALRAGGCVIAFRHARAPGTFDPPAFRLGDCSTQRNLDDEGRAQARRIGAWFRARGLAPSRVRSSPWCRCIDTAELAFGAAERWDLLGSPVGSPAAVNTGRDEGLRQALATVPAGRFEAWVTHMFVLSELAGTGVASGEGLLLRRAPDGEVQVIARLPT